MQHVIYNEGAQPIRHVPMAADGRVTRVAEATYTILDLRNTDQDGKPTAIQAATNATVDPFSGTLASAAGPSASDPTRLVLDDASGLIEGRTYIVSEAGHREAFVAHAIDSATNTVYASADLSRNYTADATVQGCTLTGTFPEPTADDEDELANGAGPFLVVWNYTISGTLHVERDQVWLTRYSLAPLCTESDVIAAWPEARRRARGQSGASISGAIRMAMEDYVAEIEAAGKDPRYFVTATAGRNAVRERSLQYLREWMGTELEQERAERHASRYKTLMRSLLNGLPDRGTIEINPKTNTAPPGTSKVAGNAFFRRT